MKRAPRSRQRHDLYAKYHDYDSEISDLLGECGMEQLAQQAFEVLIGHLDRRLALITAEDEIFIETGEGRNVPHDLNPSYRSKIGNPHTIHTEILTSASCFARTLLHRSVNLGASCPLSSKIRRA